jgi:hypothetical protein
MAVKYSSYSNVASDNTGITFDKGKIVFSFDDGMDECYDVIYPLFVSKGRSATFYVYDQWYAEHLTDAQKIEMSNAGMDIQCHASTDLTSEAITLANYQAMNNHFATLGIPAPKHTCYNSGVYNFDVKEWAATMRLTGRTTGHYIDIWRNSDKLSMGATSIDLVDSVPELNAIKAIIDSCETKKCANFFYGHGINIGGLTTTYLEAIIDYALTKDVDIVTTSELYPLMFSGLTPIETEDITLTAQGDGSGVATMVITANVDCLLELSGTARFYSDAAGTLDESTTFEYQNGRNTNIYLRCPSGTATLKVPKRLISFQTFSVGANTPIPYGDISLFPEIERVSAGTWTGSITDLANLNYLNAQYANTLSGDITNLTKLTWLLVYGTNTLTGSFNLLTLLTRISVTGNNTISGDPKIISGGMNFFYLNPCRIVDYTSGGDWSSISAGGSIELRPSVGYGLSSAEVDLLLNEISATKVEGRAVAVVLLGSNAPRTAASDAARADILADGGSVFTN